MADEIIKKPVTEVAKEAYNNGVILGVQGGKAVTYDAKELVESNLTFGKVEEGNSNVVSGGEVYEETSFNSKTIDAFTVRKNYFNKYEKTNENFLVDVGGTIPQGEAWIVSNTGGWATSYKILLRDIDDYVVNNVVFNDNRVYAVLLENENDTRGIRISNDFRTTKKNSYIVFNVKTPNINVDLERVLIQKISEKDVTSNFSFFDRQIKKDAIPGNTAETIEFNPMQNIPDKYKNRNFIKIKKVDDVFRLKFDFKIKTNVNIDNSSAKLIELNKTDAVYVNYSKTEIKIENDRGRVDNHYQQVVGYKSGFEFLGKKIIRKTPNNQPLSGNDVMSIYLSKFKDNEERQNYLEENSDLEVHFEHNLIIFRKGVLNAKGEVVRDKPIELGFISTTDGGKHISLNSFYKKLKNYIETKPFLKHFEIDYENLAEDKTTADLLQFQTVKMVTYYKQQVEFNGSIAYAYDSFPLFFPLWKDDKWHTFEAVGHNGKINVSIDGECFENELNVDYFEFGNSNVFDIKDVLLNNGSMGDAEVINNIIVSENSPYLLTLYGHKTFDQIDPAPVTHQDLPRLLRTVELLKNKGYYIASIGELWEWKKNNKKIPKRTACIILDDWQIVNTYDDRRVRNKLLKNGAKISFCLNMEYYYTISEADKAVFFNKIQNMRLIGWDVCIHTYNHDTSYQSKSSRVIEYETLRNQELGELMCINTTIQMYPFGGELSNTQKLLEYKGISLGFDTYHTNSTKSNWALAIPREPLNQGVSIERIKNSIL